MGKKKTCIISLALLYLSVFSFLLAAAQPPISIPAEDGCLLPTPYISNITENFIDTLTPNKTLNALFASAKKIPFIAYSPSFTALFPPTPSIVLAAQRPDPFASEGGVWVPPSNEVWFTSSGTVGTPIYISVLNLLTGLITRPKIVPDVVNPNGGYFFAGQVYFTFLGNTTTPGGIVAIEPATKKATIILNTYFGAPFNGPDDAVLFESREGKQYLFFSDPDYASDLNIRPPPVLPNAVWRFDATDKSLVVAVSRNDVQTPNGIKVSTDGRRMYITDGTPTFPAPPFRGAGAGAVGFGGPVIWEFDIDAEARLVNKKLFGLVRSGIADGIQVDDLGNVWTAEGEGIVVRDQEGKVLGLVNAEAILEEDDPSIANFALAGDLLVILASTRLYTVKLGSVLVAPGRYQ
ncbi:MAG: hypothetical protein LQ352_001931 [Teloschistes flavicans]|nr:MAG: hypothetical protein LQ352_001931 [Teloschistes flavicans]